MPPGAAYGFYGAGSGFASTLHFATSRDFLGATSGPGASRAVHQESQLVAWRRQPVRQIRPFPLHPLHGCSGKGLAEYRSQARRPGGM